MASQAETDAPGMRRLDMSKPCIAYLGPEIPALSATFIYEELLGLERRGVSILP